MFSGQLFDEGTAESSQEAQEEQEPSQNEGTNDVGGRPCSPLIALMVNTSPPEKERGRECSTSVTLGRTERCSTGAMGCSEPVDLNTNKFT
jgi:hypothetical protein